jgi:hypothetical protein
VNTITGGTMNGGTGGATSSGGTGGVGGMAAGAAGTMAPACDAEMLLAQRCGTPGCHAADAPQIDLASPDPASRLIDQSTTEGVCAGNVLIASDGSESLLLDKLEDSPPCGIKMPLVGTLDDADIECVAEWVDALVEQ